MILEYARDHLSAIEADRSVTTRAQAVARLRELGFNDYASILWTMPRNEWPKISSLLPKMASEDVQRSWTGFVGDRLLNQSISFMRAIAANYSGLTGSPLHGKRILDFGCGYGRFVRMSSYYSDDVWGVDPWDESIRICKAAGLTQNIFQSDYLPATLPVPNDFDLMVAFSVFTHLSDRALRTCLSAMRKHIKTGGIACITSRPIEYWRMVYGEKGEDWLQHYETHHRQKGFAFLPHNRPAVDGDITYGDTSFTLDWITPVALAYGWKVESTDRTNDDPVQRFIFLKAI